MPNRSLLFGVLVAMTLFVAATACSSIRQPTSVPDGPAQGTQTMKPSITYAYLLRQTPFFTGLDTIQLHGIIHHSHEREVQAGQTIVSSQHPGDSTGIGYCSMATGTWSIQAALTLAVTRTQANGANSNGRRNAGLLARL